jgi:hypothetical protein
VLHELSHVLAGIFLGYDMGATLNKAFPVSGSYSSDSHYQLVSAAGPLFTLVEALIVFLLMRSRNIKWLYPFLFTCFYMRFFAAGISFLNPNDEARISRSLGLGTFTLPVIMTAILFWMLYTISRRYGFSKKFNLLTLVLVIFFSSIIILSDQFFSIKLL